MPTIPQQQRHTSMADRRHAGALRSRYGCRLFPATAFRLSRPPASPRRDEGRSRRSCSSWPSMQWLDARTRGRGAAGEWMGGRHPACLGHRTPAMGLPAMGGRGDGTGEPGPTPDHPGPHRVGLRHRCRRAPLWRSGRMRVRWRGRSQGWGAAPDCRDSCPQGQSSRRVGARLGMGGLARGAERGGWSGPGRVVVWLAAAATRKMPVLAGR